MAIIANVMPTTPNSSGSKSLAKIIEITKDIILVQVIEKKDQANALIVFPLSLFFILKYSFNLII